MSQRAEHLAEERRIYFEGIRLFNEGQFFEAHDAWEENWRTVLHRRREQYYRAIIQSAVTLELLRRGRAAGVRKVFISSGALFDTLPTVFMGLNIPEFRRRLRDAIEPVLVDLDARHVQIDPTRLFTIELEYDPFETSCNSEEADGRGSG
ncbi:MAG: DUF309 domain-containing protein [Phycisphaerae bacterium]|nr:DUF309 domain-containing protein [Phycisphaerae bacterium]